MGHKNPDKPKGEPRPPKDRSKGEKPPKNKDKNLTGPEGEITKPGELGMDPVGRTTTSPGIPVDE